MTDTIDPTDTAATPVAVRRRIDSSGLNAVTEGGLYQALIDTDAIAPPAVYRIQSPIRDAGPLRVPVSRYTTPELTSATVKAAMEA